MYKKWYYNEFEQVGKDYGDAAEVAVYDSSHADFRDVDAENRRLLDRLELRGDETVVDFGCGTGAFAVAAAKECRRVIAVDVSQAMLATAWSRAEAAGVTNVEFVNAGFLSYEHEGERADVVTSSFSFHHLPDFWKGVALERVSKILRREGLLFLRDVVLPDEGGLEAIEAFVETQARLGGDFLREDAEGHFREEFSSYDWVLRGLLERAGFAIERVEWECPVVAEYSCRNR